jgi:hypothetical protein
MLIAFMVSRFPRAGVLAVVLGVSGLITVACQRVPLLAPSGSTITLVTTATTLPTGGSTQIIAQVIEPAGTPPHEGTHVTFTTSLGSIQPSDAETDISGRAIVQFVAGNTSGTATISAISGGVSVAAANQIKILIGAAAVGFVSVSAAPATLSSGGGTSTITATVSDTSGNVLPNVPVTFAVDTSSSGTAGGTGTLSASVVNSDANGHAVTNLTTTRTTTVSATAGVGAAAPPATGGATPTPTAGGTQTGRVTVTVNTTNTISIGAPAPATPIAGQAVTFPITYGTVATASPIVRLSVDWGDGITQTYAGQPAAISHTYGRSGSFLVVVTGIDAVGDTTTSSTAVTVNARPGIAVTISANPAQPAANQVVTFTITATPTTGATITSITTDFGDGARGTLTGNVGSVQHVYTRADQFIVTVTASDSSGATGSASIVLIVGTFTAPTAAFTISPPSTGTTSTVFQFNASDSSPQGNIVSYAWDFGDGGTASGATASHQYSTAATYTIRLTVTDTAGRTGTLTKTVTVS